MPDLIGRDDERRWLEEAVAAALAGRGGLVLLAGEAGVGKTRLAEEVARSTEAVALRGGGLPAATPAYGPIVAALRCYLRLTPGGLAGCGPLRAHLAVLLPELGPASGDGDRATLCEAIRCALATASAQQPVLVILDDLQWSDAATLELLAALAAPLRELPVLILGAYRSDEIPRAHPLRRLRTDLRRGRALRELALDPLDEGETATLAEQVLAQPPSRALACTLHDRTQGVPFFVEELAGALAAGGRLQPGRAGLELAQDADVPVPETVRDAVLLRAADLSDTARTTAEAASVAGPRFDFELVEALGCGAGLGELLDVGLIAEVEPGGGAFRHALARDAIYEDVPWLRRRELHRQVAETLAARGGGRLELASHWLAARDTPRALDALVSSAQELCAVHAYRDASRAGQQALELWPDGERESERIDFLEGFARCAELSGQLNDATRALREAVAARRVRGADRALARAERRLATVYDLNGDRERALAGRQAAAEVNAAIGEPAEAAADRLVVARYLQAASRHDEAIEFARAAGEEARRAGRTDLRARALGLEGVARARRGELEPGVETVRSGLSLALEHGLTAEAAEVYQRLGTALEQAADYGAAQEALETALGFCQASGDGGLESGCMSCMAYVLRERGDWEPSREICRDLQHGAPPDVAFVADGVHGAILVWTGDHRRARPMLLRGLDTAAHLNVVSMQLDCAASLAALEAADGEFEAAAEHCRYLLRCWEASDDHHYSVRGLRWAACFLATHGYDDDARACAAALARIVADARQPDALAALAHALGELALLDGDAAGAAEQLTRALDLQATLEIPFERAQIQLRAGVALAAAGEREPALDRLGDAYRTARKLGARGLASEAADEVAKLGESVERRLGRRAAAAHEGAGLSRRELEVVRLVAVGRTNREIAHDLFLSTRTVDSHLRSILVKLDCRSRTEAAARAGDLGLLV
jgi:DNA-binding NarL/FixJ family response regulator